MHVGVAFAQRRPFRLRFLDAALAEVALAGGDEGRDLCFRAGLADGDQLDRSRIATGKARVVADAVENPVAAARSIGDGR